MNCLVAKELVGRSQPDGDGQWLDVQVNASEEWCPSGVRTGTSVVQYFDQ